MDKLISDVPKLISEWDYEKNQGIDPSKVKYKSGKKYHWKCQKGHQWQGTCDSRRYVSKINSHNCPFCNNKRVCLDNCLRQTHPKIAEEWHPYKNFPITPLDVVYGTDKKYWWYKKECNHEWEASCNNRTSRNSNCPYCDGKKICLENCLMKKRLMLI